MPHNLFVENTTLWAAHVIAEPLSSESGTHNAVTASVWPWLQPFFQLVKVVITFLDCSLFAPLRFGDLPVKEAGGKCRLWGLEMT